jgi:23S rRNA-/tRNA-specific pseudouridylate synthase
LQAPMASLTHFQVLGREYYNNNTDLPVTRVTLTSISGRTHQLNVHCAAYGHPIVRDQIYGYRGDAAPQGGLAETLSTDRVSLELQKLIYEASKEDPMSVHCKLIRFKHPVTKEVVEVTSPAPF